MDGIQTKIYCPECHAEIEILLHKHETPELIKSVMKGIGIPFECGSRYMGYKKCSCGKEVKIIFSIEVEKESEVSTPFFLRGIVP